MKMRKSTLLILAPAALVVALLTFAFSGAAWMLHTESGARWAMERVQSSMDGHLKWKSLEGDLDSGLIISGLEFDDGSTRLDCARSELRLGLGLWPSAVKLSQLKLSKLDILSRESTDGEPGDKNAFELEDALRGLATPLRIELESLSIAGLNFSTADDDVLFHSDRLTASARLHERIEVERLRIDSGPASLSLQGSLSLSEPFTTALTFDLALEDEASMSGNLTGELERLELAASGRFTASGFGPLGASLQATGSAREFTLQKLELDGPELNLVATGSVRLQPQISLSLGAVIGHLEPVGVVPDWPSQHPLSGTFELLYEAQEDGSRVGIPRLDLSIGGTDSRLRGHGAVDLVSGSVEGELNWKSLAWPPGSEAPEAASPDGAVTLEGTPANWTAQVEMGLEFSGLPPGRLRFLSHGDQDGAEAEILESSVLGGTLSGRGEYRWRENQPWSASLSASGINPSALLSAWPGSIDLQAKASGQAETKQFHLEIDRLAGSLRDRSLSANGLLSGGDGSLNFGDFTVRAGDASLWLDGALQAGKDLSFSTEIDSLGWFFDGYLPGISGDLRGAGAVSWSNGHPALSLEFESDGLRWNEWSIGGMTISSEPRPGPQGEPALTDFQLDTSDLSLGGHSVEKLRLEIAADPQSQNLVLQAQNAGRQLRAVLSGALDDWRNPARGNWAGTLDSLSLSDAETFSLALIRPSDLTLSTSGVSLAESCLSAGEQARICLRADWTGSTGAQAEISLAEVPASLAEVMLTPDLEWTQVINGTARIQQGAGGSPSGTVRITMSPGNIHYRDDPQSGIVTDEGVFSFEIEDGRLTSGQFDINFPGTGLIDVDFQVVDLHLGAAASLDGQAIIKLDRLQLLPGILPYVDEASGQIDAEIEVMGQLGTPRFGGNILLIDAAFEHLASGLRLSEVNLDGQVYQDRRAEFRGSFKAGEGSGELFASAELSDMLSPRLSLGIQGEKLQVVDVPDLKITADPDLRLGWHQKTLTIDGSLFIPSALIAPKNLQAPVATESPDLVIIAGAPVDSEQSPGLAETAKIRGRLDLSLGDDINIDLAMAQAKMGGSVEFQWQDSFIPVGNGLFEVVGRIEAFGQMLRITQGKISFPDIPSDNPHLNIRAERDIYGNTQVRTAGVFVAGTLRRPAIEPFTVPMTNRDRAQTLLITGSDFNYEQGVGAVDVGMYVAPRLFISYGIGLFDNENVISARYDLSRGFGIKATSGQKTTGLDFSYTIER
jgi:translocation and assembly module TamB